MTPCPFCQPDPQRVFFQGSLVQGLWDAFPVSPGHALLVTRRHIPDWFSATQAEQRELTESLALARDAVVQKGHLPEGFNVGINLGEVAGQTVPHLHVHLIPRYRGDVTDPAGGVRHVIPERGDYLARRLVTGHGDPLLPHLYEHLDRARRADVAVAFVTVAGVELILPRLREMLERGGTVRLLTGDQEDFNDPRALLRLLDLGSGATCQLRVFRCDARHQFHPKFYLFEDSQGRVNAFVGSSNLTDKALQGGVEWNYRVGSALSQVQEAFDSLFHHPNTHVLDQAWIEAYRLRRKRRAFVELGGAALVADRVAEPFPEPAEEEVEPPPEPHPIQQEALAALQASRAEGYQAGLVVLATGLGKTWLAAFDSLQPEFRRVLFVAHREEILTQARDTFRRIRPEASLGFYTGQEKLPQAEGVFASIQTLGRTHHLRQFAPESFDYIVVDEFHHASADSYRRLLDHFRPRFLLGLTATPERTDGGDLLGLCEENLVYRCDFWDGIEREQLCGFRYFGVPDVVDYRNIPWRNSRFDPDALDHALITEARAQNALEQYRLRGGRRTLAFCCSRRHSNYMADFFSRHGLRAVAVHSGPDSSPRAASLEQLRDGELDILCCVDMFNEGVDLPGVDTLLMLRPTESRIIWLQQIGRGLRRAEGKPYVTVIDYIGNHRTFLLKPLTLLGASNRAELAEKLELVMAQKLAMPSGCEITYELEAVNILEAMLRQRRADSEALKSFYQEFEELHGVRPTAREAYHESRAPRSARKGHGSWLGFVDSLGGLNSAQQQVFRERRSFLEQLETMPMTRCYKMLVLEAMLARDQFPGQLTLAELATEVGRLAARTPRLQSDFHDQADLQRLLETNPIAAWTSGKGTDGATCFRYADRVFSTTFRVEQRAAFQQLTREILEWRLAEYLNRPGSADQAIVCKVSQASGRPILFLPSRAQFPQLPQGWTPVTCDGVRYEANIVKVAINVVRPEGGEGNVLPQILQGWFGPDAGQPGTSFRVALERDGEGWSLRPLAKSPVSL